MNYGLPIHYWIKNNKDEILKEAGYKLVPNHTYAKLQPYSQWINNCGIKALFPRYHLIFDDKQWWIHRDNGGEDHNKISLENLKPEIERLKRIEYEIKHSAKSPIGKLSMERDNAFMLNAELSK